MNHIAKPLSHKNIASLAILDLARQNSKMQNQLAPKNYFYAIIEFIRSIEDREAYAFQGLVLKINFLCVLLSSQFFP